MQVRSLGQEDSVEKEMAIHSGILAWKIPQTEKPGGHSPRGRKESDMTEWLNMQQGQKSELREMVLFLVNLWLRFLMTPPKIPKPNYPQLPQEETEGLRFKNMSKFRKQLAGGVRYMSACIYMRGYMHVYIFFLNSQLKRQIDQHFTTAPASKSP